MYMLCLRSLLTAVLAVCLWSSVVSAFAGKKKTRGKQNRVNFSQLGYTLSAITMTDTGFDGTLSLVEPYNLYGDDITPLQLKVLFESDVSTNYPYLTAILKFRITELSACKNIRSETGEVGSAWCCCRPTGTTASISGLCIFV